MSMAGRESTLARMRRKWRERKFTRAFTRHKTEQDAVLVCAPRMARLSGRLLDISQGGGMFRPALSFLMDRRGMEGTLVVEGEHIACRIVRTLPVGYAVQFIEILSEEQIAALLPKLQREAAAA